MGFEPGCEIDNERLDPLRQCPLIIYVRDSPNYLFQGSTWRDARSYDADDESDDESEREYASGYGTVFVERGG